MNQKEYLTSLEQACGVKAPVYVDRNVSNWLKLGSQTSYWAVNNLSWANEVANSNIVGRQRLTLKNSNVSEAFFDVESNTNAKTRSEVDKHYHALQQATKRVYTILNSRFKIPEQHIYVKSSGKGFHVSVFFTETSEQEFAEYILTLLYCIGLPNSKSQKADKPWTFGLDVAVTLREGKVREFGGENEKLGQPHHYCSLVQPNELSNSHRYPFNDSPNTVQYPQVKPYAPSPEFKERVSLYKLPTPKMQVPAADNPPEYNKEGDTAKLCNCPLVASLINKADSSRHLQHQERIFLSQLYVFFGRRGEEALHRIIRKCSDYDEAYTQMQIDWVKRHGRKPITCAWAKQRVGCPQCSGSGGKSPIKFVYRRN